MKRSFTFLLIIFWYSLGYAQIGGLSASKLNTLSATTVQACHIEFEPSLNIERDIQLVHTNVYTLDTSLDRGFNFRFTYGVGKRMEAGFSVPVSMDDIAWGAKFLMVNKDKLKLSAIAGLDINLDNNLVVNNLGGGLVATLQYTDDFSSDFELVYLRNLQQGDHSSLFFNMDHGVYVGKIQYILGLNSMFTPGHVEASQIWLTPGITIEPARQFLMVITYSYSLLKSDFRSQGLSLALTITLE